jgi:peptide/nickel transport system ATP-binding protein
MSRILEVSDLNVTLALAAGTLRAVRAVSFEIEESEILGVVGESGCGKSLTALAVMDLLPARTERRVARLAFAGQDIAGLSSRQMSDLRGNRMSMIFQEPMTSLNPVYTIGDQLEEVYRRHRGRARGDARRRALALLDRVGIPAPEQRLRQYPHQLSGGLRQRVMIAMALMCEPALIICDEPTTALDVTIQAQVLRLLRELQTELRMAIMLITHDLGVVAHIADRILVMYAGEAVELGRTAEIFREPCHPYTQGLLRCLPRRTDSLEPGTRLGTIPGVVPTLIGDSHGCAFANRCPHVLADCRRGAIDLAMAAPGHAYRCLLSRAQSLENRDRIGRS